MFNLHISTIFPSFQWPGPLPQGLLPVKKTAHVFESGHARKCFWVCLCICMHLSCIVITHHEQSLFIKNAILIMNIESSSQILIIHHMRSLFIKNAHYSSGRQLGERVAWRLTANPVWGSTLRYHLISIVCPGSGIPIIPSTSNVNGT